MVCSTWYPCRRSGIRRYRHPALSAFLSPAAAAMRPVPKGSAECDRHCVFSVGNLPPHPVSAACRHRCIGSDPHGRTAAGYRRMSVPGTRMDEAPDTASEPAPYSCPAVHSAGSVDVLNAAPAKESAILAALSPAGSAPSSPLQYPLLSFAPAVSSPLPAGHAISRWRTHQNTTRPNNALQTGTDRGKCPPSFPGSGR